MQTLPETPEMARAMTTYSDDFQTFWKAWPGRYNPDDQRTEKVGKHEAFVIWRCMPAEDREFVLKIVGKVKDKGRRYLPDAWKWLAKKMYEDFA